MTLGARRMIQNGLSLGTYYLLVLFWIGWSWPWWAYLVLALVIRVAFGQILGPWVREGRKVSGVDYDDN